MDDDSTSDSFVHGTGNFFVAEETERLLAEKVSDAIGRAGRTFLGRDRAFRRYWLTESVPGLYVEHDDEHVGECLPEGMPWQPDARPMDETQVGKKQTFNSASYSRTYTQPGL